MSAARINHVSVHAVDLQESTRFYVELFGMQVLPTPRFGSPVVWLRHGDQQLHLFAGTSDSPAHHHFGLDVDDLETVYWKAKELGLCDARPFGAHLRHHPAGWVQLYLRDPAGNLVEVNWPDAETLSAELLAESQSLADMFPQTGDAAVASLYLEPDDRRHDRPHHAARLGGR